MNKAVFILKKELDCLRRFNEQQEKERSILLEQKDPVELLGIQQKKKEILQLMEVAENKRRQIFEQLGIKSIADFNEEMKDLLHEISREWRRLEVLREYNLSLLRDRISFNTMYLEALKEELEGSLGEQPVSFDRTA